MQFAPGERWAYNNSGYVLLGAIVEKASGKTYEAFVRERIFEPLGMTASYYDRTEAIIPRRAPGYTREGDQPRNARYLSMTQPYAAGSLASTVDDLARWDASLYTEKLLKKASLERAWTPYVLKDGKPTGYGYGWGVVDAARPARDLARRRHLRLLHLRGAAAGRARLRGGALQQRLAVRRSRVPREEDRGPRRRRPVPGAGRDHARPEGPRALRGRLPDRRDLDADGDGGERPALHAAQRRASGWRCGPAPRPSSSTTRA